MNQPKRSSNQLIQSWILELWVGSSDLLLFLQLHWAKPRLWAVLEKCLSDAAREVDLLRFATQVEAFVFRVAGAALCDVTKVQFWRIALARLRERVAVSKVVARAHFATVLSGNRRIWASKCRGWSKSCTKCSIWSSGAVSLLCVTLAVSLFVSDRGCRFVRVALCLCVPLRVSQLRISQTLCADIGFVCSCWDTLKLVRKDSEPE